MDCVAYTSPEPIGLLYKCPQKKCRHCGNAAAWSIDADTLGHISNLYLAIYHNNIDFWSFFSIIYFIHFPQAVLVKSVAMDKETPTVKGYDFDQGRDLDGLLESLFTTGYQVP